MNNLYYCAFAVIILTVIIIYISVSSLLNRKKKFQPRYIEKSYIALTGLFNFLLKHPESLSRRIKKDEELRIEAGIEAYNQSIHNQFDQLITLYVSKPAPQGSVAKTGMLVPVIFGMHKKIEELEATIKALTVK